MSGPGNPHCSSHVNVDFRMVFSGSCGIKEAKQLKICSNYKITHTIYSICLQFNHQNMFLQNSPSFFFFPPSLLLRVKKKPSDAKNLCVLKHI